MERRVVKSTVARSARMIAFGAGVGAMLGHANADPVVTPILHSPDVQFANPGMLSGDGSTVIGNAYDLASLERVFRWRASSGFQVLAQPDSAVYIQPSAVSFDGSKFAGTYWTWDGQAATSAAFRWTDATGVAPLGVLPGTDISYSGPITADGNTVYGRCESNSAPTYQPSFRWSTSNGLSVLNVNPLPGGSWAFVSATSADGAIIAGVASNGSAMTHAVRWAGSSEPLDLGVLAGDDYSDVTAIAPDGQTIVGYSGDFSGTGVNNIRPFRWTSGGGIQDLGLLPTAVNASPGYVSPDGSLVFGYSSHSDAPIDRQFVWTESQGLMSLDGYLASIALELNGWTLTGLIDMSDDGTTWLAYARDDAGVDQSVVITGVPAPTSAIALLLGAACAVRRRRR